MTLGRCRAVVSWVTRYRRRLERDPPARGRSAKDWREAARRPRARRRLERALRAGSEGEAVGKTVLALWVPRLAPGRGRRGISRRDPDGARGAEPVVEETPERRRELGEGLAYWAANYHTLPEAEGAPGDGASVAGAGRGRGRARRCEQAMSGSISGQASARRRVGPIRRPRRISSTRPGTPSAFLSDLTETFAGVFLASVPPGSLITFIHGVTGPSAVRLLLPYLDAAARASLRVRVAGGRGLVRRLLGPPRPPLGPEDPERAALVDRADRDGRRARDQVHGGVPRASTR